MLILGFMIMQLITPFHANLARLVNTCHADVLQCFQWFLDLIHALSHLVLRFLN